MKDSAATVHRPTPEWLRWVPVALALAMLAYTWLVPIVKEHAPAPGADELVPGFPAIALKWTYLGAAVLLLGWWATVRVVARAQGKALRVDLVPPQKNHYIQGTVQLCIYTWWGLTWPEMPRQAPLIVSQALFLIAFEAMLAWSRGRSWRMGFGFLPIILSTNVFLWFRPDYYYLQFALIATCALGKDFVHWKREGRWTHIFNPSAFGLTIFSIVVIAMHKTDEMTFARELATTLGAPPNIYLLIFGLGMVVQFFFGVTLMTLFAALALVVLNMAYTGATGLYQFVNSNLPIAVFLGLHLLMTDPSTSPRTNVGRAIFGFLYGTLDFYLFNVLQWFDAPELYAKLLAVPILNICVQWFDAVARAGFIGDVNRAWETCMKPARMNLVHMGCWAALFTTLMLTGFIGDDAGHPGKSVEFWKKQYLEGNKKAGPGYVMAAGSLMVNGNGAAANELGYLATLGEIGKGGRNPRKALEYFTNGVRFGDLHAAKNLGIMFLFERHPVMDSETGRRAAAEALALLEIETARAIESVGKGENAVPADPLACVLVGRAYELGRGRPSDVVRAVECYARAGTEDPFAAKGLARIRLAGYVWPDGPDLREVVLTLDRAVGRPGEPGDGEAAWYLAHMCAVGCGVQQNEQSARALFARACQLGLKEACEVAELNRLPSYTKPRGVVLPPWQSAYPIEGAVQTASAAR